MVSERIVGWICRRCRHFMEDNPRYCPECLFTVYEPVWESGPTERQAEQLLTGQEP